MNLRNARCNDKNKKKLVIKFVFTLCIVLHSQEQEAREKAFRKPEESNFAGGENYPSRFKQ
jgi:hypothetical protein